MIKAVIYDMDGILIDSEPFWRKAEIEVFKQVGIELSEEDCLKTLGFKIEEVEDYWYARQPWPDRTKGRISGLIVDKMIEYVFNSGKPMEGVQESLDLFKEAGLKIGLASSSHLKLIEAVINKLNIKTYFDAINSAEKEVFGKPHPAVFIRCAQAMQVSPENCIIIEDSPSGVIAARAAKARVIAIPESHNWDKVEMGIAHFQLKSLLEIRDLNTTQLFGQH